MKKIAVFFLVFILMLVLFRSPIYRATVKYKPLQNRAVYKVQNRQLTVMIEKYIEGNEFESIEEIVNISLSITAQQLEFSSKASSSNPNNLIETKNAHCVGYAAFFSTVCNYLLRKTGKSKNWTSIAKSGHLFLFGENVHSYFNSSFFRNHDFVLIKNTTTGETLAVDPSVYDYLGIRYVALK